MRKLILAILVSVIASLGLTMSATSPANASDQYGTDWHASAGTDFPWGPFNQYEAPRSASLTMATKILNHPNSPGAGASAACAVLVYPGAIAACVLVMQAHWENVKDAARKVQNGTKQDCLAVRIYQNTGIWPFATPVSRVTCYFGITIPPTGGGGGSWRTAMTVTAPLHVARLASKLVTSRSNGTGGGGSW